MFTMGYNAWQSMHAKHGPDCCPPRILGKSAVARRSARPHPRAARGARLDASRAGCDCRVWRPSRFGSSRPQSAGHRWTPPPGWPELWTCRSTRCTPPSLPPTEPAQNPRVLLKQPAKSPSLAGWPFGRLAGKVPAASSCRRRQKWSRSNHTNTSGILSSSTVTKCHVVRPLKPYILLLRVLRLLWLKANTYA